MVWHFCTGNSRLSEELMLTLCEQFNTPLTEIIDFMTKKTGHDVDFVSSILSDMYESYTQKRSSKQHANLFLTLEEKTETRRLKQKI